MKMFRTSNMKKALSFIKDFWKLQCSIILLAECFLLVFTRPIMAESGLSSIARAQTIWIAPGYALVKSGDTSLGPDSVDLCRAHVDKDSYFTYENLVGVDEILDKDLFEVLVHNGKLLFRRAGHTSYFTLDLGDAGAKPAEMPGEEFKRFYVKHRPVFVSFERFYFWKSTFPKMIYGLGLAALLFVAFMKYRRLGKLFRRYFTWK